MGDGPRTSVATRNIGGRQATDRSPAMGMRRVAGG